MINTRLLPFRLGTTSYILADDLVANARYLANSVQDMELVLFDLENGPSNLPDSSQCDQLLAVSDSSELTYTVHLPLDIHVPTGPIQEDRSMVKAALTIERTRRLNPWAYIAHLDGKEWLQTPDWTGIERWRDRAVAVFETLIEWVGDPLRLCIENLEHYPVDFIDPLLERLPISRCVDIGHLWVDHHHPLDYLPHWLDRARVVHLHGIGSQDHQSLVHVPREHLYPVLNALANSFRGVATLELFGEADFSSSIEVIQNWCSHDYGLKGTSNDE